MPSYEPFCPKNAIAVTFTLLDTVNFVKMTKLPSSTKDKSPSLPSHRRPLFLPSTSIASSRWATAARRRSQAVAHQFQASTPRGEEVAAVAGLQRALVVPAALVARSRGVGRAAREVEGVERRSPAAAVGRERPAAVVPER
ncbi:hypothetical protein EE612_015533 [Oryza sativa]|nr:hypothetical protein EE612_015533 [Oryza sativa]